MFTFWDYKRNRWPRDAGLRLDHLLLSPALAPRLVKAGVDRAERAEEGASDHAPAWIVIDYLADPYSSLSRHTHERACAAPKDEANCGLNLRDACRRASP